MGNHSGARILLQFWILGELEEKDVLAPSLPLLGAGRPLQFLEFEKRRVPEEVSSCEYECANGFCNWKAGRVGSCSVNYVQRTGQVGHGQGRKPSEFLALVCSCHYVVATCLVAAGQILGLDVPLLSRIASVINKRE
jgi:hypothetical protein